MNQEIEALKSELESAREAHRGSNKQVEECNRRMAQWRKADARLLRKLKAAAKCRGLCSVDEWKIWECVDVLRDRERKPAKPPKEALDERS